jgi:hypothetical protein
MVKYLATVQYLEGRAIGNSEFNVLSHLATSNRGNYRTSSLKGGSVTFSFTEKQNVENFENQSKQLDDIVAVKIVELQ